MKVHMLQVTVNETKPFGTKYHLEPRLYSTESGALDHVDRNFPSASEITKRLRGEASWRDDIPRTWYAEVPTYDDEGEWDYSIEYTITINEVEVHN